MVAISTVWVEPELSVAVLGGQPDDRLDPVVEEQVREQEPQVCG